MTRAEVDVCTWYEEDWGDYWSTSCDNEFVFTVDGPKENEFKYCPYCGRELVVKEPEQDDITSSSK